MTATGVSSVRKVHDREVLDLADDLSVEGLMEKMLQMDKSNASGAVGGGPGSLKANDSDRIGDLIEGASKAIEILSHQRDILEVELRQERSASSEQARHIAALKSLLTEVKDKACFYESQLKSMTLRCQTAESRIAGLEQAQKIITVRASRAESISNRLQRQIEAAFGQGSPVRSVMDDVKLQQAAE